jgi:hypothetical protein
MSNPNDRQVGGTYYRSKYQHWDMATDTLMRHLEGAASKYLSRFGNKPGEPASKDLEKAGHYIEKLIDQARHNVNFEPLAVIQNRMGVVPDTYVNWFVEGLSGPPAGEENVSVLRILASWNSFSELEDALAVVNKLKSHHVAIEQEHAASKGMD